MKKYLLTYSVFIFSIIACEQEEIPVIVNLPAGVESTQLMMGSDYSSQLFFDLGSGAVVASNDKTTWDLGFESQQDGWRIWLNAANGGSVAATGTTNFESVVSPESLIYNYDLQNGNPDSTAFGDYRGTGQVFVVNRGYASDASSLGFFKLVVLDASELSYTIKAALLDGSNEHTLVIPKNSEINLMTYSFVQQDVVSVEPPKSNWDLLFTQYTHLFANPPTPYIVTGVLLNRYNVKVAVDTFNVFDDINLESAGVLEFSSDLDIIGYDWKFFDFSSAVYLVDPTKKFIIRDTDGDTYKLHFVDFYDENGIKGAPEFEWQKL